MSRSNSSEEGSNGDSTRKKKKAITTTQQQTNNNKEQEIYRIKTENKNIIANLIMLEKEQVALTKSKSDCIRELGENFERLKELGEYDKPLEEICSTICEMLRSKELLASESLAYQVLPLKYKQEQFTPNRAGDADRFNNILRQASDNPTVEHVNDNSQYFTTGTTYPDQSPYYHSNESAAGEMSGGTYDEPNKYVPMDYLLKKQNKPIDAMNVDEIRDTTEGIIDMERKLSEQHREVRRRKKELQEKCVAEKIALAPEYEFNRNAHISTPTDVSGTSLAWEKFEELIEQLTKVQDKIYKFQPDLAMAKKIAEALEWEIKFWQPVVDEKFRKDQISWWITEINNLWHGKHAAATKAGTEIDHKIMRALEKHKVDPSSVTPELRELLEKEGIVKKNMTREQVGDKALEVVQSAIRFAAAQKLKAEMYLWYLKEVEPNIGIRAANLHDTLSEKSFT